MRRLIFAAALVAPSWAFAQPTQPTPQEIGQAGVATASDLSTLVVQLRAQLLAEQRENAALREQAKAAPKPDVPKEAK